MNQLVVAVVVAVAVALPVVAVGDEAAQDVRAVTLDGRQISSLDDLAPRTLLVASFHRAANQAARRWRSALDDDPRTAEWSVYSVVVLEGAPGMIRRMVSRTLRGDVPPDRHGSYLIVEADAEAWRALVGSSGAAEDEADAVFVARLENGVVCARHRGAVGPAAREAVVVGACAR